MHPRPLAWQVQSRNWWQKNAAARVYDNGMTSLTVEPFRPFAAARFLSNDLLGNESADDEEDEDENTDDEEEDDEDEDEDDEEEGDGSSDGYSE